MEPSEPVNAPAAPPPMLRYATPKSVRPPSVWGALGEFVLMLVILLVGQALLGFVLGLVAATGGAPDAGEAAIEWLVSPLGFVVLAAIAEASMAFVAICGVIRAGNLRRERLGMLPTNLSSVDYALLALGTLAVGMVGVALAGVVSTFTDSGEGAESMWAALELDTAIPFVLIVAFGPGFFEELFFRGYLQRKLLRRMPPWMAIGLTSLLFALIHGEPGWIAFAFVVGVWLGVIAWRTGSIWPGVVCHAVLNGVWNVFFISVTKFEPPPLVEIAAVVGVGLVGLICFLFGFAILWRTSVRPQPEDIVLAVAHPIAPALPATEWPSGDAGLASPKAACEHMQSPNDDPPPPTPRVY